MIRQHSFGDLILLPHDENQVSGYQPGRWVTERFTKDSFGIIASCDHRQGTIVWSRFNHGLDVVTIQHGKATTASLPAGVTVVVKPDMVSAAYRKWAEKAEIVGNYE